MKLLISLILYLMALFAMPTHANITAEKQRVEATCHQEAKMANCGDKKVGTGLIKCIHNYKITNKAFHYSDTCKSALGALSSERKAQRRKKQEGTPKSK